MELKQSTIDTHIVFLPVRQDYGRPGRDHAE